MDSRAGRAHQHKGPRGRCVVGHDMTVSETDKTLLMEASAGPDPLSQLRGYWEGLRVGGGIPARSRISPRGIEQALSCTFLIERVAPGIARFRIAGMDLAEFMGMEVRGMPFSAIFCPLGRIEIANKLERVFQDAAILTADLVAERGLGRPALTARMLALPLCNEQGSVNLAIGCMALSGKVGRTPRRFDVTQARLERTMEAVPNPRPIAGVVPKLVVQKCPEFAEAAAVFERGQSGPAPYLRVVK